MKILYLTQWFDPEPFFKGVNFVKKLKRCGHHVEVLTGFPNYPFGKLYDGYKMHFWKKEKMDGIPIIRTALFPSHSRSKIGRIFNYFSFTISSTITALFKMRNNFDLIYVYHPPITVGITALVLKLFWKTPYIYEIQDLWPDTLKATGMIKNNFFIKIIEKLSNLIYNLADSIIVISPGFKKRLVKKGINSKKINIIYNSCDEKNIYPREKNSILMNELKLANKFNIFFAGNMGKAQSLVSVLDAALLVSKELPDVRIIFIGDGVESNYLKQYAKDLNLKNIIFMDAVGLDKIGEILSLADILLVHLKIDPLFEITIPGKTQACMALGKPIIMGVKGDAANLLTEAKAGIICKPEDASSISNAIKSAYKMPREKLLRMGQNGNNFYNNRLSLDIGLKKLNKIFDLIGSK